MTPRLLAATAIVLLYSGPTHAGGNFANVAQDGRGNEGDVLQSGSFNAIGTAESASPGRALQQGRTNVLVIEQSGDRNRIGQTGDGLDQAGRRNLATITQTSDDNAVGEVQQDGTASGASGRRNRLHIRQGGSAGGNLIGSVRQTRGADSLFAPRSRNRASLQQLGNGNTLRQLDQQGSGNTAFLTQSGGDRNFVDRVEQQGDANFARLSFSGGDNGLDGALLFDLAESAILQHGVGNELRMHVAGDGNRFAARQSDLSLFGAGAGFNDARVSVDGSYNRFAVDQAGANLARLTIGDGLSDDNGVHIRQDGANVAYADVGGLDNAVFVDQEGFNEGDVDIVGDGNEVALIQRTGLVGANLGRIDITGGLNLVNVLQTASGNGANDAGIDIAGSRNHLNIDQTALGGDPFAAASPNAISVSIFGNDNNSPLLPNGFTGRLAVTAAAHGLAPGDLVQSGSGNSITMNVGTAAQDADRNLFAFSQSGTSNVIEGTVVGADNQALVVQHGSGNSTIFAQFGNGNFVEVLQ